MLTTFADRDGFNNVGVDRDGYDLEGFGADGYNREGFDMKHRDIDGYFDDGADMDGFTRDGLSLQNIPRELYDDEGYDPFGFDVWGYSRSGLDREGLDVDGYNLEGYNHDGYDLSGFDKDGYDSEGFDRRGRDREGYSQTYGDGLGGWNAHHRNRAGRLEYGFEVGPDGNARRITREGPSAEIMECEHETTFVRSGATCAACRWDSNIFHRHCRHCGVRLCRACDGPAEAIRRRFRERYLWPGVDSFGIDALFEDADQVEKYTEEEEQVQEQEEE